MLSKLSWVGFITIALGLILFLLFKKKDQQLIPVILCAAGVILFICGFYIKKH